LIYPKIVFELKEKGVSEVGQRGSVYYVPKT
jgi:hypothetical protein